jgi:acetyl esterase/lipase
VTASDRVSIESGVVFGRGGRRELKCDVFTPPQGTANGAGVLLIHGGGWAGGDRTQLRGYGILLGRAGYTCVACEYRLTPEARWPAQIHDVKAALRWMRASASDLGIEPAKIVVEGNSAGGHLALMLAGTPGMPEFEGDGGNPGVATDVAAAIAFYAPTILRSGGLDIDSEGRKFDAVSMLLGADAGDDALRAASPITYVHAGYPPTMLIHGTDDALVPHEATLRMQRALHEAGVPVEVHVYDGLPHGFDALPSYGRQTAQIMTLYLDRKVVNPGPVAAPARATTG